ncbi:MAG: MG2 domain-containing protein [Planctomycetota bacterium]|nr:MG2 domain-containing protein [Planctomycetota bacterium]
MKSTSSPHHFSASLSTAGTRNQARWLPLLAVLCLMGMGGWATAGFTTKDAPSNPSLPAPPESVRKAITSGETEKALELLTDLQTAEPESADLWAFYQGVALQNAERWAEAGAKFEELPSAYPKSPWILRSTYRRAEIAQQTRDFTLAESIYRDAAAHLLSENRQAELAGIYNGLADLMAAPQDPTDPESPSPRHRQAVELYSKAYALQATPDVRAHAAFAMGRSHQELGDFAKATRQFSNYLELVDDRTIAKHWEARLALAQCAGLGSSARQQRRVLQNLLRAGTEQLETGGTEQALARTIRRSMAKAQHQLGDSWLTSKRIPLALSAWEKTLALYPDYAERITVATSIARNTSGDEQLAAWEHVLAMVPSDGQYSGLAPAKQESLRASHERLLRSALYTKGLALKQRGRFNDAIRVFGEYTRRYPDGVNWSNAQQSILDSEFGIAHEAREGFNQYLTRHPLDKAVAGIQFAIGSTYIEEAQSDGNDADAESLYRKAIAQWELCAASQGTNDAASMSLFHIGQTLEDKLLDAGAAVEAYRRVTFGSYSGRAQSRLEAMVRTNLSIVTQRTARTNEPARIKVQTRNIESLEVHVHALDLESYFRKHRTHARVEDLDLDLIAPEKHFTHSVAEYSQYSPMEFQLEVPVAGPGVWVVSVIGGEKRATTLLLSSDLDMVVKASNHDVFVFVQDMLKGTPAANVNVLLAVDEGSTSRIVSVTTGDDGVARWQPKGGRLESQNLHALALSGGNVASTGFHNRNLNLGKQLASKSVIYSERPAYRPGGLVHWRAIALKANAGQWTSASSVVSKVALTSPAGRTYRNAEKALSERGSVHGTFQLPDDATPGRWSLVFTGKDLQTTRCHFEVESFRMPMAEVVLTVDKSLAWRGDSVTITAEARTTYGAPLANTLLTWHIPGHGEQRERTNAEGKAEFVLETQEYGEAQFLTVNASLPTENVHGSTQVQLAVSGYSATIETERSLELAGTTFPVVVWTRTPDGQPTGQTMTLRVLRKSSHAQGRWQEELQVEQEIKTDAATGRVSVPIEVAKGGDIVIAVQGRDQFDQRIESRTSLKISGTDDVTKLRLLTSNNLLDLGQTGSMKAVNRSAAGLALMTVETDRVLEYRLVHLPEGTSELQFESKLAHVPTLNVGLAYMDGNRFHEANARFSVQSKLNLEIIPEAETATPAASSRITLRATDGSGQPIQGEFSVAAVEEALFQLYPQRGLNLAQHFAHPGRSFPSISTRTTCQFSYVGSTQAIAQGLLDEAKRVKRENKWKADRKRLLKAPAAVATGRDDWAMSVGEPEEESEEMERFNEMIGIGGGAGGKFGGRSGGRRNLKANGGSSMDDGTGGPPESPTALWIAQLATDANGIGVIDASWPNRSTRWRLTAHGVADGNRFASATSHVTTKSDFFVELLLPPLLSAGDRPQIKVKVHDLAMQPGTVDLELHVLTLSGPTILKAQLELGANAIVEHTFPLLHALTGPQEVQVTAVAVVERDSKRLEAGATRGITVQAQGWKKIVSRSGSLVDQTQLNMELAATGRTLELHFGVTLEDDLISQALGQQLFPTTCRWNGGPVQQASDLMAACSVYSVMQGQSGHPAFGDLQDRIQGLVSSLASSQLGGGGWSWGGMDSEADAHSSAHVAQALSQAATLGWSVDDRTAKRMAEQLRGFLRDASNTDIEMRTHLQYALASMGQGDFAALNRLYRSRAQMSTASKAHLALALAAADRVPMASEVVTEIESAAETTAGRSYWKPTLHASWVTSQVETTALVALAQQAVSRPAKESKKACEFLSARRPWPNPRARGFAVSALARQGLQRLPGQANGFVAVHVIGQGSRRVALNSSSQKRTNVLRYDLPDAAPGSRDSKVTVDLTLSGNVIPQYTAILKGHSTETPQADQVNFLVKSRMFLTKPARYEGQQLSAGFSAVRGVRPWYNQRKQIEAGEVVQLEIQARRHRTRNLVLDGRVEYLEMEVPIPSGLEIHDSRRPGNRPYRLVGNSMIFPLGPMDERRSGRTFRVNLVAAYPGVFPAARVLLRSAYPPELWATSDVADVTLLPEGTASTDGYRMTPDESLALGRALFQDEKYAEARSYLLPLLDEFENKLRPQSLKDVARLLLFASVDGGDPSEIVRYFEIVKQREPDLFVPIEKVLQIGAAYAELGEHERAMLIFRATLNESFGKDLQIVGLLDQQNHWLMATRLLDQLIGEYPNLPLVVETDLTLADRVLRAAPSAHDRKDLRNAGADRAALTGMGIQRLRRFLALNPGSPLSADAALNLVSAYFDLEDHKASASLCSEMAPLHEEPVYQDAFRYSGAVSSWYLGQDDSALVELEEISNAKYTQANGSTMISPNRSLAKYIMAQIYHARKDVEPATRFYREVEEIYPDAALALGSMLDQELDFEEEVLRVHPGETVQFTLTHRNVEQAEMLVYPVDLMTLYLREKDLSRVTQVNLAGVSPKYRGALDLPSGASLRSQELQTTLPLTEPGAYLVILRGGSLHASSLVLISDIELDVDEFTNGQVRVQVSSHKDDAFLKDVDVRVLGSDDGEFSIGKTDLRGLFSADSVRGKATIIARMGHNHYAFHRGTQSLSLERRRNKDSGMQTANPDQAFFFSNVNRMNGVNFDNRAQTLDQEIQAERKGVQVQKAY